MSMTEYIEKFFAKKPVKIILRAWELIALFVWLTTNYSLIKTDVDITYKSEPFNTPASVLMDFENTKYSNAEDVYNFINSETKYTVEIENTSSAQIEDISLVVKGIKSVGGVHAFSSNYRINQNIDSLFVYDLKNDELLFPNFVVLQKNTKILIDIYCDKYDFIFDPIVFNSTTKKYKTNVLRQTTGLGGIIDLYEHQIYFLLFVVFLYFAIKRWTSK